MNKNITSSGKLKWILSVAKGYKWRMFWFFFMEVSSIAMSLLFVLYSKKTIDIALGVSAGDLNTSFAAIIVLALSGVLFKSLGQWINQKTQIDMTLAFQYQILEKQMLSIWRVIKKWDTGDLLVRINTDSVEITQMISSTWISFLITCLKIVASFIFLYSLDSTLAIVILAITPLFLFAKVFFRRMRTLNAKVKQGESEIGSATQENLRYRIMLRALGVVETRLNLYKQSQLYYFSLKLKYLKFTLFSQGIMRSALTCGYLIAFGWGVYQLKNNTISFGTMTAFLQLVNQIQTPILTLGSFLPALVKFKVAKDRIMEINTIQQNPLLNGIRYNNVDRIELENISFSYEDEKIIKNLTTAFKKGEITAILGASGKGKTTLIRLLLGLIPPDKGSILIIDKNTKDVLQSAHIENFSYVPQGNTLLKGTIRENITIGLKEISEKRLQEALYISCCEFVYDLPSGLDTLVGESGLGLSEGQAQRISIARAILRNRNIWLFDEATSALDQETIGLLLERIKCLIKDKIVIFVTHDQRVALECNEQLLIN